MVIVMVMLVFRLHCGNPEWMSTWLRGVGVLREFELCFLISSFCLIIMKGLDLAGVFSSIDYFEGEVWDGS